MPSWFPGAVFKKVAEKAKVHVVKMAEVPFNMVKERKVNLLHQANIISSAIFNLLLEKW